MRGWSANPARIRSVSPRCAHTAAVAASRSAPAAIATSAVVGILLNAIFLIFPPKAKAAESNKLLLIDFYATWCYPCKQMEREVFSRTEASEALGNWVAVKVDVDRQAKPPQLFQVVSVPTLVALSPQGKEIARVNTGMDLQQFVDWIKKVENIAAGRAAEPTTNTKQAIAATPTAGTDKAEGWAEGFEAAKARAAEANRLLFVDFYATWCGPCRITSPILKDLAAEYGEEIYVYKIDVDREPELAAMFGVQSIPMFLFIPMNENPQVAMGALPKESFREAIDTFLLKKDEKTAL